MYHLITGRVPVDGQSLDPRAVGVLVPDDLRNVILACCNFDPRSRPSMQQVLAFLSKTMPIQATKAAQPTPPKAAMSPTGVEGGIGALGALAVFVGLVALLANDK
jgi:hypothetical protein